MQEVEYKQYETKAGTVRTLDKTSGRVVCRLCKNQENNMCIKKKTAVKPNKRRNCDSYLYDEAKYKPAGDIPTVRIGYAEAMEAKKRAKSAKKMLKTLAAMQPGDGTARQLGLIPGGGSMLDSHPLTGDLSRFTTTAAKPNDNDGPFED